MKSVLQLTFWGKLGGLMWTGPRWGRKSALQLTFWGKLGGLMWTESTLVHIFSEKIPKSALQLTFWGKLGGLMWTGENFFGGVFFGPKFRPKCGLESTSILPGGYTGCFILLERSFSTRNLKNSQRNREIIQKRTL